jgi:hypothetical protein
VCNVCTLAVLDHFSRRPLRQIEIEEGDSLTLSCVPPYGVPAPTVFWLFRHALQKDVIETINREHITGEHMRRTYTYLCTADTQGQLHFSFVSAHDGREHLLYQCAATSAVLHGEYRAGDQVKLIVKPTKHGRFACTLV